MSNIVKVKHFVHTEGSGAKEDAITEFETFINSDKVNPIEISHSYSSHPHRTLSIFVVYADVDEVNKNVKGAVNVSEEKTKAKKKTKTKKTNTTKKASKSS